MKETIIMTVEDHKDTQRGIKLILESAGYKVLEATSGKECIKKLSALYKKRQLPDLILMDIMMPEMSGWDAVTEIRKNTKWDNVKLCFLSVVQISEERKKSIKDLGVQGYIMKPFTKKQLLEEIKKILKRK